MPGSPASSAFRLALLFLAFRCCVSPQENTAPIPPALASKPSDALVDFALASEVRLKLQEANVSGAETLAYTTTPRLARSFKTTSWLNRDRRHVMKGRNFYDEDTQLKEGNKTLTMAGNLSEKQMIIHMTRHGLYRRADSKFAEFVAQPTGSGEDGYGLWRTWESDGACPLELLIADPWGSISWEGNADKARES